MREYTDQEIRSELYAMWQEIGQQKPRRNGRTEWSNEEAVGSPIKIIPFDQIKLNEDHRPYLVKGLIPREGLSIVWAPPKSVKASLSSTSVCMLRLAGSTGAGERSRAPSYIAPSRVREVSLRG
jgi:hypothetical protein